MTDPGADDSSAPSRQAGPLIDRRAVIVLAVVVLALFAAVGYFVGVDVGERRHDLGWQTGVGHVGSRVITIETDDWSYGARDSVDSWIDTAGTWHESGWPPCLRLSAPGQVSVRFAAHEVTVDGMTWRPITTVDCRATRPLRSG